MIRYVWLLHYNYVQIHRTLILWFWAIIKVPSCGCHNYIIDISGSLQSIQNKNIKEFRRNFKATHSSCYQSTYKHKCTTLTCLISQSCTYISFICAFDASFFKTLVRANITHAFFLLTILLFFPLIDSKPNYVSLVSVGQLNDHIV